HFVWLFSAAAILCASPAATQVASPPTVGPHMPSDIDPHSGFRLPLPKREDLDDAGKAHYDRIAAPGASIVGLRGPSGIGLFGPNKLVELVMLMGNYAGTAALLTAVDMQLHPGEKPLLPIP